MRPLLVNADYDSVLAGAGPRPAQVALVECLALWIETRPLLAHKSYPPEFLDHVESRTGHRPQLTTAGPGENWWGSLADPSMARRLNSKVWALDWWKRRLPMPGTACFSAEEALAALPEQGRGLLRRAHGVSGRGHCALSRAEWSAVQSRLQGWFAEGVVVEPLLPRTGDVSALWLPEEGRYVFYRNEVDGRFQWRSACLERGGDPRFTEEETIAMGDWHVHLEDLAAEVSGWGHQGPFSVDAFFYLTPEGLRFQPCSEVNARKTMGWVARALWQRCRPEWAMLHLLPRPLAPGEWARAARADFPLVLSPAEHPFTWLWSEAESPRALRELVAAPFSGTA